MHNALNRLQTSFGFFTTCAFTLAALVAILSVLPIPAPTTPPSASISVRNVQVVKGRPHYYSPKREEYAQIRFDLDADLSGLFNWNTKQVFVYITANYPSSNTAATLENAMSEAVIWDMIIPATTTPFSFQTLKSTYWPEKTKKSKSKSKSKSKPTNKKTPVEKVTTTDLSKPGLLSLKNQKPKYQLTDPSGVLSERGNVTLQVSWNVQPWVGALVWDKGRFGSRVAKWAPGKEGRSAPFEFPPLKGAKPETVKEKDGAKVPEAAEATPVIEI